MVSEFRVWHCSRLKSSGLVAQQSYYFLSAFTGRADYVLPFGVVETASNSRSLVLLFVKLQEK